MKKPRATAQQGAAARVAEELAAPAVVATPQPGDEIARRVLKHWHEAVPSDRNAHLVKDTTRSFLRSLQLRLAQHDVQLGHWTFLRILWHRDGLTQRELSAEAGVMEPTTLIALRAMEALGYIRREHKPDNRKNIYVYLTPLGRRLEKTLVPLAEEVNAIAVQGLSPTDIALARRVLLTMIANLAHDPVLDADAAPESSRKPKPGPKPGRPRD
jgi:DNA-binding MarR family transcriptional regulator